jgi:hypothetical protein
MKQIKIIIAALLAVLLTGCGGGSAAAKWVYSISWEKDSYTITIPPDSTEPVRLGVKVLQLSNGNNLPKWADVRVTPSNGGTYTGVMGFAPDPMGYGPQVGSDGSVGVFFVITPAQTINGLVYPMGTYSFTATHTMKVDGVDRAYTATTTVVVQ